MNNEMYDCPKCKGVSKLIVNGITFTNIKCDFCCGKRKLTWLETIFGVDHEKYLSESLNGLFDE